MKVDCQYLDLPVRGRGRGRSGYTLQQVIVSNLSHESYSLLVKSSLGISHFMLVDKISFGE